MAEQELYRPGLAAELRAGAGAGRAPRSSRSRFPSQSPLQPPALFSEKRSRPGGRGSLSPACPSPVLALSTFVFVKGGRSFVGVFDTLESMYQMIHWWHWLTYGNAFPNAVALQALTGAVSALAAIAAGGFAYRAYRATREQLLLLRTQTNAMLMGERPWVTLEVGNWTPGIQTFGNLEAAHLMPMMLALKNVGRTPARIDAIAFDATVVDSLADLPPEPVYPPADQECSLRNSLSRN